MTSEPTVPTNPQDPSTGALPDDAPEADTGLQESAETPQFDEAPSDRLQSILESLLFAADRPLRLGQLQKLLGERSPARVRRALEQLAEARQDSGVVIMEVDAGYQLRTNPENARWVKRLEEIKPVRMSRAALEVLAVVAYRQPVTRVEVDNIRGVDSGAVLRQLLARDLVRIVGRQEEPGRPFLYGTTREFLTFFSLNKLDDLPPLRDVTELAEEQRAASQAQDVTPPEDEPAEAQDVEIEPDEIAGEDAEELREDTGDDEVAAALEEARAAARGADNVRSRIRRMARSEREEGVGHAESRAALQSLEDLVQRRRQTEPSPEEQAAADQADEVQDAPPVKPDQPAPEEPSPDGDLQ